MYAAGAIPGLLSILSSDYDVGIQLLASRALEGIACAGDSSLDGNTITHSPDLTFSSAFIEAGAIPTLLATLSRSTPPPAPQSPPSQQPDPEAPEPQARDLDLVACWHLQHVKVRALLILESILSADKVGSGCSDMSQAQDATSGDSSSSSNSSVKQQAASASVASLILELTTATDAIPLLVNVIFEAVDIAGASPRLFPKTGLDPSIPSSHVLHWPAAEAATFAVAEMVHGLHRRHLERNIPHQEPEQPSSPPMTPVAAGNDFSSLAQIQETHRVQSKLAKLILMQLVEWSCRSAGITRRREASRGVVDGCLAALTEEPPAKVISFIKTIISAGRACLLGRGYDPLICDAAYDTMDQVLYRCGYHQ